MPTDTAKLCALVSGLRGHDIEKMAESEALAFKAQAMSEFSAATAGLPALLLPGSTDFSRLVWHVEPAEPYCLEWIGRFSLRATERMEANLGQPRLIAMAVAMWPDVELIVDLMGEYHYAGGLSVEPTLQIAVRVDGAASEGLECLPPSVCDRFEAISVLHGVELRVRTVEDAMEDQQNPRRLQEALRAAREAAVEAAQAKGHCDAEALEVQLILASGPGLIEKNLPEALASMGLLFAHCDAAATAA